jgi:tyrosinase
MNIRNNQATLSHAARLAFSNAVLTLKTQPSRLTPPTAGRYDDYVWTHLASMQSMTMTQPGWAHMGPAFLPWHRYLIRQFELDLQTLDPTISLPYWDWTVDNSSDPNVPGSPWTEDLLGGDGDTQDGFHIVGGPFAGAKGRWTLNLFDDGEPNDPSLRRNFGSMPANYLPTVQQVNDCLNEAPFYIAPWRCAPDLMRPNTNATQPSFANRLEGWYGPGRIHNNVHVWVSGPAQGSMAWMSSPNDPVFFLHHCNIDRLWAKWQADHPTEHYYPTGAGGEIGPTGHNLNDPMQPWGASVTPASVIDHVALGYTYDTEPLPLAEVAVRMAALGRAVPRVPFKPQIAFPRFGFAPGEAP